jgi:hypothetical protein
MSLAQNSLPDERGSDLREPLRLPAGRQVLRTSALSFTRPHSRRTFRRRTDRSCLPWQACPPWRVRHLRPPTAPPSCDSCCKYPNFSDLLIMEDL